MQSYPLMAKTSPYEKMVESVHDGGSNVALASLWLTQERYEIVDMSIPFETISMTFLVPMSTLIDDAEAIYQSLNAEVWFILLICLVFLGVFLATITKIKLKSMDRRKSVGDYMFYLIEIGTGHGTHYVPRHVSIRYIFVR